MILDKLSLEGKTALVTGASRGLGQRIAVALAEAGADVACHSREDGGAAAAIDAVAALGRKAMSVVGDMADPEVPKSVTADILINNAGMIRRSPAVDYSEEDWSTVIQVNLSSVFRLSQAVGRHMVERGSGKIVNIAQQGGLCAVMVSAKALHTAMYRARPAANPVG